MTYRTKPAAYLAIGAMRQAAKDYRLMYPKAAERIVLDKYVNDFLSGTRNIEEARELKNQVSDILKSARFDLNGNGQAIGQNF